MVIITHFYKILVILYDNVILVKSSIQVRLGAALVVQYVEFVSGEASLGLHVDTIIPVHSTLKSVIIQIQMGLIQL